METPADPIEQRGSGRRRDATMRVRPVVSPAGYFSPGDDADEYCCPVCGVGLSRSNFATPEADYFCPNCTTRQTPTRIPALGGPSSVNPPVSDRTRWRDERVDRRPSG
jgi:hypothetical protein